MITITQITNAVYKSADGNIVDVDILTEEHGLITTTVILDDDDQAPHMLELKTWIAVNSITPYVPIIELPVQASARKDAQVEQELGTEALRVLVETLLPYIDVGLDPVTIINEAKAKRRAEL